MNCQTFEQTISDLAREQLLEVGLRDEALRHTSECSTCGAKLEDERRLTSSLHALATQMSSASAPTRVEESIMRAFQARTLPHRAAATYRWRYWGAAAAAVLLISLGIGFAARNWSPTNSHTTSVGSNPTSTKEETGKAVVDQRPGSIVKPETNVEGRLNSAVGQGGLPTQGSLAVNRRPFNRRRPVQTPATETVASATNSEVTTDFMPIGYVNSLSMQDGGSVVRVELPRSSIVNMGFAVNMDRYNERVKADVLMGADGVARAIRFVQ